MRVLADIIATSHCWVRTETHTYTCERKGRTRHFRERSTNAQKRGIRGRVQLHHRSDGKKPRAYTRMATSFNPYNLREGEMSSGVRSRAPPWAPPRSQTLPVPNADPLPSSPPLSTAPTALDDHHGRDLRRRRGARRRLAHLHWKVCAQTASTHYPINYPLTYPCLFPPQLRGKSRERQDRPYPRHGACPPSPSVCTLSETRLKHSVPSIAVQPAASTLDSSPHSHSLSSRSSVSFPPTLAPYQSPPSTHSPSPGLGLPLRLRGRHAGSG